METKKVISCVQCRSSNTNVIVRNNANGSVKVVCNGCGHIWTQTHKVSETITYTEDDVRLLLLNYNLDCISFGENLLTSEWFEEHKKK